MNHNQICWIGRHEGILRDVARGCAYGDQFSIDQGGRLLSAFVKEGSILIPMPSHIGYATTMLSLCRAVKRYSRGCRIRDCLKCSPHESSHVVKLHNGIVPQIEMHRIQSAFPIDAYRGEQIYVIDNTIATGATAMASLNALPWEMVTVLSITKG